MINLSTEPDQAHRFVAEMRVGDVVITPDQRHHRYLRGTITSEYAWDGGRRIHPHYRRVKWTHEVLRKSLHDDTRRVLNDRHAVIPLPDDVARALEYLRRPL